MGEFMDLTTKVWLANEVRVWGLLATAIIGGISWAAALTHSRWQSEFSVENARIAQDKERASNEKIAELRRDTAEANARVGDAQVDIAKANQQIAEANAREKIAEVRLEQLRKQLQPRVLNEEAFLEPLKNIPPQRYKILHVRDTTDGLQLSIQIMTALDKVGWTMTAAPAPIEKKDLMLSPDISFDVGSAMSVGGQPTGVS